MARCFPPCRQPTLPHRGSILWSRASACSAPAPVPDLATYRHQFGCHAARVSCYHIDMRVMAHSLSLLLLALAMMLPAAAEADARAEVPIAALTAFVQSATPGQAKRIAMQCYRCFGKACSASACGASCGSAIALAPLDTVLTSVISAETPPTSSKVARDYGIPPDPHPPRPIAIV